MTLQEIKNLIDSLPAKEINQEALKERASNKRIFIMGSAVMDTEELLFRILLLQWMDYEVVLEEAGINEERKYAYNSDFMKKYLADLCTCDYVLQSTNGIPQVSVTAYQAAIDAINIVPWTYHMFTGQVAAKLYDDIFYVGTLKKEGD